METKWKSTFHQRINELYEESKDKNYKMTQEEYAAKLGTTRSALRGWLEGKGQPDADGLAYISTALNISVDWLVGKSDLRSPRPTTIALSRSDDPDSDLPDEALKQIEDFRAFIRQKYKKPD